MHRSPSSKCDCEMRPPFYNFYSPIELAAAGLILNLLQLLNRIINPHSTRESVMFIVLLNFSTWRAEKWAPISSSCPLLIWLSSQEYTWTQNVLLPPRVLTKHAKLFTEDGECNSVRKLVMINLGVNSPGSSLHSRQFPTRSSTERNWTNFVILQFLLARKKQKRIDMWKPVIFTLSGWRCKTGRVARFSPRFFNVHACNSIEIWDGPSHKIHFFVSKSATKCNQRSASADDKGEKLWPREKKRGIGKCT